MAPAPTPSAMTMPSSSPVRKFHANMFVLPAPASDFGPLPDDHLGADLYVFVEIRHVRVGQPETSGRHRGANGPRLVGAVDAINGAAEIHGAGAERIAGAASHPARQIRLPLDHLRRRRPVP